MNDNAQDNAVALRARLKQRRAQQSADDRDRGALLIRGRLYTWLATTRTRLREAGRPQPENIAAFWSMDDEPGLQALLRQWGEDDTLGVSLPAVVARGQPLQFRRWKPDTPMRPGAFGILEPDSEPAPPPDIVLVPTLGYTRQGDRLGYGGGYYDRTLASIRASGHPFIALGIAWACGDLGAENYTPAPHDVRLDGILTDKGWALAIPELH